MKVQIRLRSAQAAIHRDCAVGAARAGLVINKNQREIQGAPGLIPTPHYSDRHAAPQGGVRVLTMSSDQTHSCGLRHIMLS
jgi:hypothetical protein